MKIVKINEIAQVFNGYAFKSNDYLREGYQVIRIANVQDGYISNENPQFINLKDASLNRFILHEGEILISLTGNVGRVGKLTEDNLPAVLNQRVGKFIIKSNQLYPDYLFNFFRSPSIQQELVNKGKGIAQKNIGSSDIENLEMLLPPLEAQIEIVKTLDQADNLRQMRKQAIDLLDDYLKTVFLDMFGDPVINPKKIPLMKFNQVGTLDRGKSKHRPRNAPELLGGKYPLIQTGEVSNSEGYIRKYSQTYSEIGLKQSRMWPVGTLCITIAANIAKTGILTFEACFPDSIVGFSPNDKVRTEYVQSWLGFLQKILEDNAPEAAQKNINLEILRNLDIPIPPIALQDKFVKIVRETVNLKQKMLEQADELDNQFQSLMQQSFNNIHE